MSARDYEVSASCPCKDPISCCLSCFCYTCTVGTVAGNLERGSFSCSFCLFPQLGAFYIRRQVQDRLGFSEPPSSSVWKVVCCPVCSLAQDSHEVRARKLGPQIQSVQIVQPVPQIMTTSSPILAPVNPNAYTPLQKK